MTDPSGGEGGATANGRTLKSLKRSFDIVAELKARDGARVTELADATGLSKSSVHKHLATLRECEFVAKDGDRYRLGLRFLDIGGHVRNGIEGNNLIQTKLRELARESGETAQFTVAEHGRAVVLYRMTGEQGVLSKGRVGKRFPIHQTAAGKAILAGMDREAVDRIVARRGLEAATGNTITSPEALHEELERIRERGFALNEEESTKGLRAAAVPITNPSGETLGAFAVAGPAHRIEADRLHDDIPNLIHRIVNELELNLAHS